MNMTEPVTTVVDESSPMTVPTLVEPLTVPSSAPMQSAAPAAGAPTHGVAAYGWRAS